jgi:uncharacterized protein YhfF
MRMPWWTNLPRDRFGDTPEMADELLALVLAGVKTATCADARFEPPKVGDQTVILDGAGAPRCVIETLSVHAKRFDEVDAAFARAEGEGDLSLEFWRREHEAFFSRTSGFTPDMQLSCEHFRLVEMIPLERAQ